ncbi:unnamed protein product [Symbiodinium sp. KB8]|nr:unnamed protein product [Symbiodinium sp. KB8]
MRASTPTPGSASPCLHSSCFWSRLTTLWATLCRSRTGGLLPSRTRRLAKSLFALILGVKSYI